MTNHISELFRHFSQHECPSAPLYKILTAGITKDKDLLAVAAHARPGQPPPNMILAAVHYLLLSGRSAAGLEQFYANLNPNPLSPENSFAPFRTFVLSHKDDLAELISKRSVNTNEARRCGCLLPALAFSAHRAHARDVDLIDIGCSAGLNLFGDKYRIDYGPYGAVGPIKSPVQFKIEIREGRLPRTPIPFIKLRAGVDPDPVDLKNSQDVMWLKSLIWPDQPSRFNRLEAAIGIAQQENTNIIKGTASRHLQDIIQSRPAENFIVVQHSFVLNQFSEKERCELETLLADLSKGRQIARIGMEWDQTHAVLSHTHYENGQAEQTQLGIADAHGAWLAWHKYSD